jgi:hypothetical protein
MKKKLLVYVAGPYSADTLEGVEENCRRARDVGVQLAKCGPTVGPIVPHQLGRDIEVIGDYEYWCEVTLELMRRCDVVFAMPNWKNSKGACGEIAEAERLGILVIYDLGLFAECVKAKAKVDPCPN